MQFCPDRETMRSTRVSVPEHHRSHPNISRKAAVATPNHLERNQHVSYHYRVHTSVLHGVTQFVSTAYKLSHWDNETGNVITTLFNFVFGVWFALEVSNYRNFLSVDHYSRLLFYSFSAIGLGIVTALYHATLSYPPFYNTAQAIDLVAINFSSLGVIACRQIPGMSLPQLDQISEVAMFGSVLGVMSIVFCAQLALRRESPLYLMGFNFLPVGILISEYFLVCKNWFAFLSMGIGLVLFVLKVPERVSRSGRFDRFGQSHQLWHMAATITLSLYGIDALHAATKVSMANV